MATQLQEADIEIISNKKCNSKRYWDGLVKRTNICAMYKGTAACQVSDMYLNSRLFQYLIYYKAVNLYKLDPRFLSMTASIDHQFCMQVNDLITY